MITLTASRILLFACGVAAIASLGAARAEADSILAATYTTLTATNPDVQTSVTGLDTGLVASQLGPDGLPVSTGKIKYKDVNALGELLWFTPNSYNGAPAVTPGTIFGYPDTYTTGTNITNFFPNGPTGHNGGGFGYTAMRLSGTFVAPNGGTVNLTSFSDDATWVFINGQLVLDNGGTHMGTLTTSIAGLGDGVNTIDVFYADLYTVQASFDLTATVTLNGATTALPIVPVAPQGMPAGATTVPEPASVCLLGAGLAGLGWIRRRRTT